MRDKENRLAPSAGIGNAIAYRLRQRPVDCMMLARPNILSPTALAAAKASGLHGTGHAETVRQRHLSPVSRGSEGLHGLGTSTAARGLAPSMDLWSGRPTPVGAAGPRARASPDGRTAPDPPGWRVGASAGWPR